MSKVDIIEAHKKSSHHREEVERSALVGCFHCLAIFEPNEINTWVDDGGCAICPKCGIDSVIGDESGYPIEEGFLREMSSHWFGAADD